MWLKTKYLILALIAVENEISNIVTLVQKTDYNTNINEIKKKMFYNLRI